MKSRDVVGKKIVGIRREWCAWPGRAKNLVTSITLENGVVILAHPVETEADPFAYMDLYRPKKKP